jgi:ribonuclease Z
MNRQARGALNLTIGIVIGLALPFAIVAIVDSLASPATASENLPSALRASAAGGTVADPNGVAPDRYVYYPGTEALAADEIRVVACGTGMPSARIRQQAASFLIEVGNGEKYFFDIGTGSMAHCGSLMIPYDYLDKVFISHLHTDHWGDLPTLWAGGWTAGRTQPLKVWGPSGRTEDMGTAYAVDHLLKAYNWDRTTREYKITPVPGQIEVTEFDFMQMNQVVYESNGVVIRSFPAIHTGDGSVSYSLEYAGMKLVFGGDTVPNQWFLEYARDADLVIHEAMMTPDMFMNWYNQPAQLAWRTCCEFHTSPQGFGKIMSIVEPKMAVAYHFFNEEGTRYGIYELIRQTYDGPLSMATDKMVWNVTPNGIRERMAELTEDGWPVPGPNQQPPPVGGQEDPISPDVRAGRFDTSDVEKEMLDAWRDEHGLHEIDWRQQKKH